MKWTIKNYLTALIILLLTAMFMVTIASGYRHVNSVYDGIFWIFSYIRKCNPLPTGKITKNIYAIKTGNVNFYIYCDGNIKICIDTGFYENNIKTKLEKVNIDPGSITHIFLTHSDYDHTGGIGLFQNAAVFMSSNEKQMIADGHQRPFGISSGSDGFGKIRVLQDGQIIKIGSTVIRCILTPGHTSGSMSYCINDKLLFTGDTFKISGNKILPIAKWLNMDTELQKKSIRKLSKEKGTTTAFTGHSGYTDNFAGSISELK